MTNYIDGFALPIPKNKLNQYQEVAQAVAEIWKEFGALAYHEFVSDTSKMEGTRSFAECLNAKEDDVVVFGWVEFTTREARDIALEQVTADPRMTDLVQPLISGPSVVFDPKQMAYGGFLPLVRSVKD